MPNISAYQASLQHPEHCFTDPELKSATVVQMGAMRFPYARSGQFAVVFKLETARGPKAVRCFYHPRTEHEERYRLFHEHLVSQPLRYLTEFEYLPEGIIVQDGVYPIVKMDWVEGETLDKRVDVLAEKEDVGSLEKLSVVWRDAVVGLQGASIAHGDMQHGNILSKNGSLCLVDYDGVFIPSFAGKKSLEIGHRNYQHPGRVKAESFGLHIDHFSAFVIYLSIRALASDPTLWKAFHQDDHLLLKESDYVAPHKSEVLKRLKRSRETEIQELAGKLEYLCRQPVEAVPAFHALVKIPLTGIPKSGGSTDGESGNPWWTPLPKPDPKPTPDPVLLPTPKKRTWSRWLIVLFLLFALAASAFLCLVLGSGFYL